jgi:hypothetical protein
MFIFEGILLKNGHFFDEILLKMPIFVGILLKNDHFWGIL